MLFFRNSDHVVIAYLLFQCSKWNCSYFRIIINSKNDNNNKGYVDKDNNDKEQLMYTHLRSYVCTVMYSR